MLWWGNRKLLSQLKSENWAERKQAVMSLEETPSVNNLDVLVEALRDKHDEVRQAAAHALGILGDTRSIGNLISALRDDSHIVRKTSADSLVKMKSGSVVPLMTALKNHDSGVRKMAAWVLGRIGDTRSIKPLSQALLDYDVRVRTRAAEALKKMKSDSIGSLIKDIDADNLHTRQAAAWVLGHFKDKRAVEPLCRIISDDFDWRVRAAAAEALGRIGDASARTALVDALRDKQRDVQQAAVEALDRLGDSAIDLVTELLKDNRIDICLLAVKTLGYIGDTYAVKPLMDALRKSITFGPPTIEALIRIGPPAVDPLIDLLGDRHTHIRHAAVKALGEIRDPRAAMPLTRVLKDSDKLIRQITAEALGKIGDGSVAEAMVGALDDDDSDMVNAVAQTLQKLNLAAVDPLVKALMHSNYTVREAAARILGDIGDPSPILALKAALNDDHWKVRSAATTALAKCR